MSVLKLALVMLIILCTAIDFTTIKPKKELLNKQLLLWKQYVIRPCGGKQRPS